VNCSFLSYQSLIFTNIILRLCCRGIIISSVSFPHLQDPGDALRPKCLSYCGGWLAEYNECVNRIKNRLGLPNDVDDDDGDAEIL
jgi:hypothetical protein